MSSYDPKIQTDRLRGCIFGGALGDTIGLFTEFLNVQETKATYGSNPKLLLGPRPSKSQPKPSIFNMNKKRYCHMDQHRARFEPNAWTDDTDQTLLILLSFLRSGGKELDAKDFAARLHFWVDNGLRALDRPPLGIGGTVGGVVSTKGYAEDPQGIAKGYALIPSVWSPFQHLTLKLGYGNAVVENLLQTEPLCELESWAL